MSGTAKEIESSAIREIEPEVRTLFTKVLEHDPREAAKMLEPYPDEFVVQMLELLNPASALKILQRFNPSRRQTILATASPETNKQWMRNQTYPERSIGRLMQPPLAVFRPQTTIAEATEQIRRLARKAIITYGFVTDEKENLLGVVVMREKFVLQLRHVHIGRTFRLTTFALEAEIEHLVHVGVGESRQAELAGDRHAEQVGAAAS